MKSCGYLSCIGNLEDFLSSFYFISLVAVVCSVLRRKEVLQYQDSLWRSYFRLKKLLLSDMVADWAQSLACRCSLSTLEYSLPTQLHSVTYWCVSLESGATKEENIITTIYRILLVTSCLSFSKTFQLLWYVTIICHSKMLNLFNFGSPTLQTMLLWRSILLCWTLSQ